MNETVSIIIPVYNVEDYLDECLNSTINQTYKNLEIICINDYSTDNSLNILKNYEQKDERIKIIESTQNKGVSGARNEGLKVAAGQYIYFLDSDDWIDLDYIEKMVDIMKMADADIIINRKIISEFSKEKKMLYRHKLENDVQINSYIDTSAQIHKIFWVAWNRMYKHSFLKDNNLIFPEGYITEDLYYHYITFARANKVYYTEGANYHYRDRAASISKLQSDMGTDYIKVFSLIYDYFKKNDLLDKKMKIYSTFGLFNIKDEQIYEVYKKYFNKTINYLNKNKDIYNEMDLYFANNVANSVDYQDYVSKYSQSAVISYLRRKK